MKEYPYWLDTLPSSSQAPTAPPSSLPSPVDVAIVGGGYTGLAAARHLAKAGASVLLLERERVGWGASSRNGGQVLTGMKVDPATLIERYGEARARQLFDVSLASIARVESVIAEEGIDCEYARAGHIQAASKPSHFDALRDEQALLAQVFGHHVALVTRADQRSEIGSDIYHGLLIDERSGALNPARYVSGLGTAAARAGASIATGVAMTGVRRAPNRSVVQTTIGDIEARDVLLATNGYTDRSAPALQRRLVPIGSYIIATAPMAADQAASILPRRRVSFDSKHFLHYFRVTSDRRLLFGGRAEFSQPDGATIRRAADILRCEMDVVFPQIAGVAVEYAWGGTVAFTRDQMPRAGLLDGLYYAGGYSGHGIAMATYLGELIARRIGGEAIDHPLMDDDFRAIPMYSGRPWFLPVVGAYYRLRDMIE